jgi:hypothetical protein
MVSFRVDQLRRLIKCRAIHLVHDPFDGNGAWQVLMQFQFDGPLIELSSEYSIRAAFREAKKKVRKDIVEYRAQQDG